MLLLTSTGDNITIATSASIPVDVHATWVDTTNAGAITPGRKNTAITVAGPAQVAPPPAASTQRNVKTLHVRNKHASTPTQVLVLHTDSVNTETLFNTLLGAGRSLQYTDQGGFVLL